MFVVTLISQIRKQKEKKTAKEKFEIKGREEERKSRIKALKYKKEG